MARLLNTITTLGLMITLINCSVLKNEDPQQGVKTYLANFRQSLLNSDDEILSHFRVSQSREAVLSVVKILQNKDPFIVCEADMGNAYITQTNEIIMAEIPVKLYVKELNSKDQEHFTLRLGLARDGEGFKIVQLEGEAFYQTFQRIKNNNQWDAMRALAVKTRAWAYEKAHELEAKFDTVIWFTSYGEKNYFYVVEGQWVNTFEDYDTRNQKVEGIKMGLTDGDGEIVRPIEYELIGTIGFENENLVEVLLYDKVGYYNIETRQLVVPAVYDQIIPYRNDNAWALVKQDTTVGWLDQQYTYHPGFVSARMENWYNNFDYLKQSIHMQVGRYAFSEIPHEEYAASGIIVPPAYLSKHGLFNIIEGGFSLADVPIRAYTEYKQTTNSLLENISNTLRAVVVTVRERYLDGREEFYDYHKVMFVDNHLNQLGEYTISGTEISMHLVDSTLLEVRTPHDYWFMEEEASLESNLMEHTYFSISENKSISQLKSNRLFPQTEFVKIDSTYLTGTFTVYNSATQQDEITHVLSAQTIAYMRDEILGDNGYDFPEIKDEYFHHFKYLREQEEFSAVTREEAEARMSELDKRNYEFLNKVLQLMKHPV